MDNVMYSKVKIAGHPVHPMLVAFPVALYTTAFVTYIVYAVDGGIFWFHFATMANVLGVGMAVLAAIPGLIDWAKGIPNGSQAKATGLKHMLLNVTALVIFLINAWINWAKWDEVHPSATTAIVLSSIGIAITMMAGFLGWTLVQTHHAGVQLTPEQQRLERVA